MPPGLHSPDPLEDSAPAGPDQEATTWLGVSDELLWGFNHALSNRLAAITSITRIIEYSDTGLDPLLAALSDEIVSLERTLDLLRLVPRNPEGTVEATRFEDLLPEVLRLHQVRSELRELEYDFRYEGEPQALLVEPASLNHALLVALGAVARCVQQSDDSAVRATVVSTVDRVTFQVEARSPGLEDSAPEGPCTPGELSLVRRLISPFGGEVSQSRPDGGSAHLVSLQITLPTLKTIREREAAQR